MGDNRNGVIARVLLRKLRSYVFGMVLMKRTASFSGLEEG